MSSLGERPAVGDVLARLFARGFYFYELFSAEMPHMGNMSTSNAMSVEHIDLANDDIESRKQR